MATKKKIKIDTEPKETGDRDEVFKESNLKKEKKEVAGDPLKEIQEKLEIARQEAKENFDRFLRVSAEFENYKRRTELDFSNLVRNANESLLLSLLPVLRRSQTALSPTAHHLGGRACDRCGR